MLRSLGSAGLRFERQCQNAQALAVMLRAHPAVRSVRYPGSARRSVALGRDAADAALRRAGRRRVGRRRGGARAGRAQCAAGRVDQLRRHPHLSGPAGALGRPGRRRLRPASRWASRTPTTCSPISIRPWLRPAQDASVEAAPCGSRAGTVASLGCDCPPPAGRPAASVSPSSTADAAPSTRSRVFPQAASCATSTRSDSRWSRSGSHRRLLGAHRWPPGDAGHHRRHAAGGRRSPRAPHSRCPPTRAGAANCCRWARRRRGAGRRRRGLPGAARALRRGRHHPGPARARRRAVCRGRRAGQRGGHGQGVHQEAAGRRRFADRRPGRVAAEPGHPATRGPRTPRAAGVRQTRARRLVHRGQPGDGLGQLPRPSTWPAGTTRR